MRQISTLQPIHFYNLEPIIAVAKKHYTMSSTTQIWYLCLCLNEDVIAIFELKIRRRPDNLTSISQNNHLLHNFSVFFQKAANFRPLTSWATLFDLS